jgi:iron complex outermembrane receptor protein
LSFGAAWIAKRFHLTPGTRDLTSGAAQGRDPDLQLSLRSQMNLPFGFTIDTELRHVDAVTLAPTIPGYTEADARLGWRASPQIELFVAGDNLLHASHLENNEVQRNQPIVRTVSGGARFRF